MSRSVDVQLPATTWQCHLKHDDAIALFGPGGLRHQELFVITDDLQRQPFTVRVRCADDKTPC